MFKQIDIGKLIAHPDAPSRMSQIMAKKLGCGISAVGHYESVIVRPFDGGRYQILNGHSRVAALRALGRTKVCCDIWNIDDDAARLFVAACSSVRGTSVPELRVGLLFDLLERFSPAELGALLPESEAQLTRLLALGSDENEWTDTEPAPCNYHADESVSAPQEHQEVTMTLRMTKSQYAAIKTLLHDFMRKSEIHDLGEALAHYLLDKAG